MRKQVAIIGLALLIGCNLFENKENRSIEICQKAKVQLETGDIITDLLFSTFGSAFCLGEGSTWLDLANLLAKEEPNKRYDWKAVATKNKRYISSLSRRRRGLGT
jgi:hypothetical protein